MRLRGLLFLKITRLEHASPCLFHWDDESRTLRSTPEVNCTAARNTCRYSSSSPNLHTVCVFPCLSHSDDGNKPLRSMLARWNTSDRNTRNNSLP